MVAEPVAPTHERGAALLTVLLLVAVIAATALDRLLLSTRLAANAGALTQARAFAMAAENIATSRIEDLVAADPAQTTLAGGWMGREQSLPIPGGSAVASVTDGGNCLNLNSLVSESSNGQYIPKPLAVQQFVSLMGFLGLPEQQAQMIAISATDWIDSDYVPGSGGVEDNYYQSLETPYLPPNRPMAHPSELRAVNGVDAEAYTTLRPWICALPKAELSPINVNTLLPEQAPLLAMLVPGQLDLGRARAQIANRPANGYGSLVLLGKPRIPGD